MNSRKSLLSCTGVHPILKLENHFYTLLRRHGQVFLHIGSFGFLESLKDSDHLIHTSSLDVPRSKTRRSIIQTV